MMDVDDPTGDVERNPLQQVFSEHGISDSIQFVVYLDVLDVINYLVHHDRLSGIQKVLESFVEGLAPKHCVIEPCRLTEDGGLLVYNLNALLDIFRLVRQDGKIRTRLNKKLSDLLSNGRIVQPALYSCYLVLGAFWVYRNLAIHTLGLRERNVKTVIFIHDLFPITHADLVTQDTQEAYTSVFSYLPQSIDLFLCNSCYSEKKLRQVVWQEMAMGVDIAVAKLGFSPLVSSSMLPDADNDDPILGSGYVLVVGTREVRKNHLVLLRSWAVLCRTMPFEAIPKLVIVGRRGWQVEGFEELLSEFPELRSLVVIKEDVSDNHLSLYYKRCLFTIFPSLVEGWGIPVVESLAAGKVTVTSDRGALKEVGGKAAIYVNPDSYQDMLACILDLLKPGRIGELEKIVDENKVVRNHQEFCGDVWRALFRARTSEKNYLDSFAGFTLKPNVIYSFERPHLVDDKLLNWNEKRLLYCLRRGWGEIEDWGCWSVQPRAQLVLPINLDPGADVIVLLELLLPPTDDADMKIRFEDSTSKQFAIVKTSSWKEWVRLDTVVNIDGIVSLDLVRDVAYHDPHRELYIGVSRVCFVVPHKDVVDTRVRYSFMEVR